VTTGGYEPVFPSGWYVVADSGEVPDAALVAADVFGRQLAVGRREDGTVVATQDLCPHVGGVFTQGGRLVDGCVVCPFHGWRFDGSGRCVEIPAGDPIPRRARLRMWPVRERDGQIQVFHGRRGVPAEPDADVHDRRQPG